MKTLPIFFDRFSDAEKARIVGQSACRRKTDKSAHLCPKNVQRQTFKSVTGRPRSQAQFRHNAAVGTATKRSSEIGSPHFEHVS